MNPVQDNIVFAAVLGGSSILSGLFAAVVLVTCYLVFRLRKRNREVQMLTESLIRQEKMAALGNMLAGIAHELKTPLGAIGCCMDTRKRAISKLEDIIRELENDPDSSAEALGRANRTLAVVRDTDPVVDAALERTGDLILQLRLAGRGETKELDSVDINAQIQGSLLLLKHHLPEEVTVRLDLETVPPVRGWSGSLGQVFLNLILNACQAIDGPGEIHVVSRSNEDRVIVTVDDSGPGLPSSIRENLFRPGWTTKTDQDGTGLGLHIVRNILDKIGGTIEAGDSPQGGARFVVTLPRAGSEPDEAAS